MPFLDFCFKNPHCVATPLNQGLPTSYNLLKQPKQRVANPTLSLPSSLDHRFTSFMICPLFLKPSWYFFLPACLVRHGYIDNNRIVIKIGRWDLNDLCMGKKRSPFWICTCPIQPFWTKHPQGVHYSMWKYFLENPSPPIHSEGMLPKIPSLVVVVLVGVPASLKIVKSHWSCHNITMGPKILCAGVLRVAKIPSSFVPPTIHTNLLTSMVGLIHSIWVHCCD